MTTKFEKLTKAQKRVEIAKDVLANLKAKKIIPIREFYFKVSTRKKCHVCALGACMVSVLDRNDTLQEVIKDYKPDFLCSSEDPYDVLEKYFSENMLRHIESVYEYTKCYKEVPKEKTTCMIWIMENIIKNYGNFRLPKRVGL